MSREVACLGPGLVQLNHCPFPNNFLPLSSWSPNPQQQPCPLGEQAGVCVRQVSRPVGGATQVRGSLRRPERVGPQKGAELVVLLPREGRQASGPQSCPSLRYSSTTMGSPSGGGAGRTWPSSMRSCPGHPGKKSAPGRTLQRSSVSSVFAVEPVVCFLELPSSPGPAGQHME